MKEALVLLIHLLTVIATLLGPGGAKAVLAENLSQAPTAHRHTLATAKVTPPHV
jgi:hypothetical protein